MIKVGIWCCITLFILIVSVEKSGAVCLGCRAICNPACASDHFECLRGQCVCNELWSKFNCSWASGTKATLEEPKFNKTFLFFKKPATWHHGKDYCADIGGILAVPNTVERHEYLYSASMRSKLDQSSKSVWLGFSDTQTEGVWMFENGDPVNLAPDFEATDFTDGGTIEMYAENTTGINERWHFYHDIADLYVNYQDAVQFCARINAHLIEEVTPMEHERIKLRVKHYNQKFLREIPKPPFVHGLFYIGARRQLTNRTSWQYDISGRHIYLNEKWYIKHGLPVPSKTHLDQFFGWKYPSEPNNKPPLDVQNLEETCIAYHFRGWIDFTCFKPIHTFCEKGPYPFERWHNGGTLPNFAEPNDGEGGEDCGVMRIDFDDSARINVSDVLKEYWNDYDCYKKFSFACEIVLPPGCVTYNPALSLPCVDTIRTQTGCDAFVSDQYKEDYLTINTVTETRNIMREYLRRAAEDETTGLYKEVCNGPDFIQFSNNTQMKFETTSADFATASTACTASDSVLAVIQTEEMANLIKKKLQDSKTINGEVLFWIGLDDIVKESEYEWADGQLLKSGDYTNWSPSYRGPSDALDCVTLNTEEQMHWNQDDCSKSYGYICMKDYPEDCVSYVGGHSSACLENLFLEECLIEGTGYPTNLSSAALTVAQAMHIKAYRRAQRRSKELAHNGDKSEQLHCYGLEFPDNCTTYDGPLSVECLTSIWLKVGCTHGGTGIPYKITQQARLAEWKNYNIREATAAMTKAPLGTASEGIEAEQIRCYGEAFPPGCKSFDGPFSEECLNSIWKEQGCLETGQKYPSKLSNAENATLQAMNLQQLKEAFADVKDLAATDPGAQADCFGTVFPPNCDSYQPPLSKDCLVELWLNKVGCTVNGSEFPGNKTFQVLDQTWGNQDLSQAEALMQEWKNLADQPPHNDPNRPPVSNFQKICYGLEFPDNCTYDGPFTIECLNNIWNKTGCTQIGYAKPANLSASDRAVIDTLKLPDVIKRMQDIRDAVATDKKAQQDCYGCVFPENCTTFEGPLSVECLTSIWLTVGCTHDGSGIPYKISKKKKLDLWKDYDIKKTTREITKSPYNTSLQGNRVDEEKCKGVDLPENCTSFNGPFTMDCLITIWKEAGCVKEGDEYPPKLNTSELANINSMTILDVVDRMENINTDALNKDTAAQKKCFGLEFCPSCDKYHPTLSKDCLNEIWLIKANCTKEGKGYPDSLPAQNLTDTWGDKTQRAVRDEMKDIKAKADASDAKFQLLCYGVVLPPNCKYYPPQTQQCLIDEFKKVGCIDEGTHYPGKGTSPFDLAYRNKAGYSDVVKDMKVEPKDKLGCYGTDFPDECQYLPPHSDDCLCKLFTDYAGCKGCNGGDEGQVPTSKASHYNNLTVVKVLEEFKAIRKKANDKTKDIDYETCFGSHFFNVIDKTDIKIVLEKKPYPDAKEYCRSRGALLMHNIPSARVQDSLAKKLKNAVDYFDRKTWWIGLDDIENEGVFMWSSMIALTGTAYTNWDPSYATPHDDKDCVFMQDPTFTWNVDKCLESHAFICQQVNCANPANFPPLGPTPDHLVSPPCSSCPPGSNTVCRNGICQCYEAFTDSKCDEAAGVHSVAEEVAFGKSFLFFKEKMPWKSADAYCKDIFGKLAMPSTKERHDLIYKNILKGNLDKEAFAVYLGFHDQGTEDDWKFVNGDPVNRAPDLTDGTGGGQIQLHVSNTTSVDERWHFYYDNVSLFLSRQDVIDYCANIGGHLPLITNAGEDKRVGNHMARLYKNYRKIVPNDKLPARQLHYLAFLNLSRTKGDLDSWVDSDNNRYFNPLWWYKRHPQYPIPFPDELAKYQGWRPPDPNNDANGRYVPGETELCGFAITDVGWIDFSCNINLHPVCEKGPYLFERWHHGGTDPDVSEPNDGWCQEDCGSMRLDLSEAGKEEFSGVLTEFWNDLSCDLSIPFACEIDLPTECPTYEPPLPPDCVRKMVDIGGCPSGHMTDTKIEQLSKMTIIQVRNHIRRLKELAKDKLNGVAYEACLANPDTFTDFPGEVYDLLTKTEEKTYLEADEYCRQKGSVLPKVTKDVEDILRQKLKDADQASGNALFWIGLDDIEAEGFFEWCSGEPLDSAAGHYINWSPRFTVSEEDKDCVALDVTDDFRWIEVNCSSTLGYVCIQPDNDCTYPLLYDRVHKDQCYHFRIDPKNTHNSIYKKTLDRAEKNCEKSFGTISEIEDISTANLFEKHGRDDPGLSFGGDTKFWVPLHGDFLPGRVNATDRDWMWKVGGTSKPLGTYRPFVIDDFKILNIGKNTSLKSPLPHIDRCLYGDPEKHVYGEPFGPFEAHHYARSKSCDFNPLEELSWTWISTYHLMHVETGLCLTAPFQQVETELHALSPGVRVRPCNLSDTLQQWLCHSRNLFHLKLRGYKYSILFDKVEPFDRAHMSGPLLGESCQTLWKTLQNEYICDERYRPAEHLFIVKKNDIRPPSTMSTVCTYPARDAGTGFQTVRQANDACYLQGGKPATVQQMKTALLRGFSEGCVCAFTADDDTLRGAMLHVDSSCQGTPGLPNPTRGVFECQGSSTDYIFCFRGEFDDKLLVDEVQYTPLCATYSFLKPDLVGFQERSCLATHYFACKKPLTNTCPAPITPPNSHYVIEDWRVGQAGAILSCDDGYGIGGVATLRRLSIICNPGLTWAPNPTTANCLRLQCPSPPSVANSAVSSDPPGIAAANYRFGDKVIHSCNTGYAVKGDPDVLVHTSTCNKDQVWEPPPVADLCSTIKCNRPPHIPNAIAIYNASTQFLQYQCKEGFWIHRGLFKTAQFVCNNSGQWSPDPITNVSCQPLSCTDPPSPPHGTAFITSYRYKARVEVRCEVGFVRTPRDLMIECDEKGEWSRDPTDEWCKNVTCARPGPTGPRAVTNGTLKPIHQYGNELQYTCNETGYELRNAFNIYNIARRKCLGVDSGNRIVLEKDCIHEDPHVNWVWLNSYQLLCTRNEKCLQATGLSSTRLPSLVVCDENDPKNSPISSRFADIIQLFATTYFNSGQIVQLWQCPTVNSFNSTLMIKDTNYALRVTAGTDIVRVTNAIVDGLSTWKVGPALRGYYDACSERSGYPEINSMCTRNGTWNPPHSVIKCQLVRCPELLKIEAAKSVLHGPDPTYNTRATYTCDAGKWLKRGFVEWDVRCTADGTWAPPIQITKCTPLMCPAPFDLPYATFVGLSWSYQSTITYTCSVGMWFARGVHTKPVKCGVWAKWEPDPETTLRCVERSSKSLCLQTAVTCLDPGQKPYMSYYLTQPEVDFNAIVVYTCDKGYRFSTTQGTAQGIVCQADGSYLPDPGSLACGLATCNLPRLPVKNAKYVRQGLDRTPPGSTIVVQCLRNYWIRPGVTSGIITCSEYQDWTPDPNTYRCIPTLCEKPYFIPNATVTGKGFQAGSTRQIHCHEGFFIEQQSQLKKAEIVCDHKDAIWIPEGVACKAVECSDPGIVYNATLWQDSETRTFLERIVYRCFEGYERPDGTFEFATFCQENATFEPQVAGTSCYLKSCRFTVTSYVHGTLTSKATPHNTDMYWYDEVVNLVCDKGYWIVLDKGIYSLDFVCTKTGFFFPDPVYVSCSPVICPALPPKIHSVLTADNISAGAVARYTCAEGFGSTTGEPPQVVWDLTCEKNAQWDISPNTVNCQLLDCGPPEKVRYTWTKGFVYTFGNIVTYTCMLGKWFQQDVFAWNATCTSKRLWEPMPPECVHVECPNPVSSAHATVVGTDFSFLSQVVVICDKGYFIEPGFTKTVVRCEANAQWDLDQPDYTCKAVVCPDLPLVWHTSVVATNNSMFGTATYTCDQDYLISRTSSDITVKCTEEARWTPEPAYIKCMHKSSFLCDKPAHVPHANLLVVSYRYESIVNVTCLNGYWLSPLQYSTPMKCLFSGKWEPDSSEINCKPISCPRLAEKPNSRYVGSTSSYNGSPLLSCDNSHRISQVINGKETMTFMRSMHLLCGGEGKWIPPPDTLSCKPAGCPQFVAPKNLSTIDNANDASFNAEIVLQCPEGMYIAQQVVSLSVYCLDTGLWYPDLDKIECHPVRCGISTSPSNGTFSGRSAGYKQEVKFQCYEGYHIPPSDQFALAKGIITEVSLTCFADGTFEGIDDVIDCQRLTCSDPGYIQGASRVPLELKHVFSIGSFITYTCSDETWFFRGKRSQKIVCTDTGEWKFGDSTTLASCQKVTCWQPPHVTRSIKPRYWATKFIYDVTEVVYYNCQPGTEFNIPPRWTSHYTSECQTDGTWSALPVGLQCQSRTCDEPPIIPHSTYTRTSSLLPGANATYACDGGYELQSLRETAPVNRNNTVTVQCQLTGKWFPLPSKYRCNVRKCSDPPAVIKSGRKFGNIYESGFHVNYICDHGYTAAGTSLYFGKTFITIICLNSGRWSLDVEALKCQRAVCGQPRTAANATVATTGLSFEAVATSTCIFGHFFNQFAKPPVAVATSVCSASGIWVPDPHKLFCVPFDCGKPGGVRNASLYSTIFFLGAGAYYHCDEGYVVDHGEDGWPSKDYILARSIQTKCQYPQSWNPRPSDIRCILIQCHPPTQPPRAYISGGRWREDGSRHYRYNDLATVTCAHGYYLRGSNLELSFSARCTNNGTWSRSLSRADCIDIDCEDPGNKRYAERKGFTFRYLSRLQYSCVRGYFIRIGITSITLQCAYDAKWRPSSSFECVDVNCEDPGELLNAVRYELSGHDNYSMGATIKYACNTGYFVAQEQDAVGEWVADEQAKSNITTVCQPQGRWLPRRRAIHCSKIAQKTTIYDLAPEGQLLHPDIPSNLIPPKLQTPSPRSPSGRLHDVHLQAERAPVLYGVEHTSFHHTELAIHCSDHEVLVVHHLGKWITIEKNQVQTEHIAKLHTDVGVECHVSNMFDGEPDTYWMPIEAPHPDEHFVSWPGWIVVIDLGAELIVGSFRLHTSKNYINDVKTFYIEVSSNGAAWKILGPFSPIVDGGGDRKEFFYEFDTVQTRFVRLTISSTVLMNPPIIYEFGMYAATFDCITEVIYLSDAYAVPVFVGMAILILAEMTYLAAMADRKNRWKRFILKAPPDFDENAKEPSRMYEVSVSTAWNTCNADVLVKVVGSRNMAPILWLRSAFKGNLRPGFTDSHVIQVPCFLGTPIRIDMMCAYSRGLNAKGSIEHFSHEVEEKLSDDLSKQKYSSQIACHLRTLFSNESFLMRPTSKARKYLMATTFMSTRLKYPSYEVAGITVRDPGYGGKWIAAMPLQQRFGLLNNIRNFFFGKLGIVLLHGKPKSFVLTPINDPRKGIFPTPVYGSVQALLHQLLSFVRFLYQYHLFSYRKARLARNLTCCEKCLIAATVIFHAVFVASLLHSFANPTMYFVSRLNSDSDVLEKLLLDFAQHPHLVTLTSAFAVHIGLAFMLRVAAGKWTRKVEDSVSYWQGIKFIWANTCIVKHAFWSLYSYIRRKCCLHVSEEPDDVGTDNTSSTDLSNLDLAESLTRALRSTYTCAADVEDEARVTCNPLLTPRSRALSDGVFSVEDEKSSTFDHDGWLVNNSESVAPTDVQNILEEYSSSALLTTSSLPTALPEPSQEEFLRYPTIKEDSLHPLDTILSVRKSGNVLKKDLNSNLKENPQDKESNLAFFEKAEQNNQSAKQDASDGNVRTKQSKKSSAGKDRVWVEKAWKSAELRMIESQCSISTSKTSVRESLKVPKPFSVSQNSNRPSIHDEEPGMEFFKNPKSSSKLINTDRQRLIQANQLDGDFSSDINKKRPKTNKRNTRKRSDEVGGLSSSDQSDSTSVAVDKFFATTRDIPTPSAIGQTKCYDIRCSKRKNMHGEHTARKKNESILHVITYRAYPPDDLFSEEMTESKTLLHTKSSKHLKYTAHPAEFPPRVFAGVVFRAFICLLCFMYSLSIIMYVLVNGYRCTDGAGTELLQIYVVDISLLVFILMPVAGWIVVLTHTVVTKTRNLGVVIARNVM